MKFPEDLRYTKEHEWLRVEGDIVTLGITAFAQDELGEIVFVELPEIDKEIGAGDTACVVESTKAASDVYSAVSGTVAEVNSALEDSPDLINSDSYGEGWIIRLKGVDLETLNELMDAAEYESYVESQ